MIKVVLKNGAMLPNVNLVFMASVQGKALYSRDSIKHDYKQLLARIQSVDFIASYLHENREAKLDAYYFNNAPINDYSIEGMNKNPAEWEEYDKYVESLAWNKEHGIELNSNVNDVLAVAKQNHCGCGYRYDRRFVEQFAFFEIIDEYHNRSIWFLLPNGNVLLYIMNGDKVLNHQRLEFNQKQKYGTFFPCVLFDKDGDILTK